MLLSKHFITLINIYAELIIIKLQWWTGENGRHAMVEFRKPRLHELADQVYKYAVGCTYTCVRIELSRDRTWSSSW